MNVTITARRVAGIAALSTVGFALLPGVSGGTQGAEAEKAATIPRSAAADVEKKALTPEEVSRELVKHLASEKLPWQFYTQYAELYTGFAKQLRARITDQTPAGTAKRVMELVAGFERVAVMIESMTASQKAMDDIRNNNTTVPFEKRSETFKQARLSHARDSQQLVMALQELARGRSH